MSKKHDMRVNNSRREKQTLQNFELTRPTLSDTRVKGRKIQRSRNEKLDRLQRNLTNVQSCEARASWNYYPDEKRAYIG